MGKVRWFFIGYGIKPWGFKRDLNILVFPSNIKNFQPGSFYIEIIASAPRLKKELGAQKIFFKSNLLGELTYCVL